LGSGDSKLLCREVIARLQSQGLHFLAPLPRSAELDEQFLTLDPAGWERLDYLPQRQERLAPEEQTQYLGQEAAWEWSHPKTGDVEVFRRLFVISSEERATCRKVRTQQMARAEAELAKVAAGLGKRQLKTEEKARLRVEQFLKKRRVSSLYRVQLTTEASALVLRWEVDEAALARAEALDGYYVLLCSWPKEKADASTLLRRWKGEWQIERRFGDWKGPLKVRPVFLTSNARMAALLLLLHLALMIYSLLEREARRRLTERGEREVGRLLAGHVDAIPTGANILVAFENLLLLVEETENGRLCEIGELWPEQQILWRLLGTQAPVWR